MDDTQFLAELNKILDGSPAPYFRETDGVVLRAKTLDQSCYANIDAALREKLLCTR